MIQKTYTAQDEFPAELQFSGIYKIQSISYPDRVYIGSSINIRQRWKQHIKELKGSYHHAKKLQRHVNKYGIEDLLFIPYFKVEKESLIYMEQSFMLLNKPYFNSAPNAGSRLGMPCSEEAKLKLSKANKGRKHTLEARRKISECQMGEKHHFYGKNRSELVRKKIAQSLASTTVYTFANLEHGIITCTQYELRTTFNLNKANLSAVIRGKVKSVKGWTLVTNVIENC
jgi:group I intron endonuclease